ncbi:cytochrome c oxidase assembly protein [Virgibacillus necropolis]|uniref:cytochrome c oxidase assembly protein n=1 Tax=Virgibacillus necropolis TaxID=163877 RepID=UPI00384BF257
MPTYLLMEISSWWNIPLLALVLGCGVLYLLVAYQYSAGKKRFLLGLFLLYICLGSPIYGIGHLFFSVHMIQMAILYFFVPPLLLIGVPRELIEHLREFFGNKAVTLTVNRPMVYMFVFCGLFALYHIPMIFDAVMTNWWLHKAFHSILLITALGMWSPVIMKWPLHQKKRYMRWSGVIIMPACLLLVFADAPLYKTYQDPATWATALHVCFGIQQVENLRSAMGLLSSMTDQRLAGVSMLVLHQLSHFNMIGKRK